MAVKLRLARFGCRNLPFYRVYAADSRSPRNGKHLEILGYYNPLPGRDGLKRIGIKLDRAKYWLSVGAQPTEVVSHLLWKVGLLPRPPMPTIMSKEEAAKTVAKLKEEEKAKARIKQTKRDARKAKAKAKREALEKLEAAQAARKNKANPPTD